MVSSMNMKPGLQEISVWDENCRAISNIRVLLSIFPHMVIVTQRWHESQ